MQQDENYSTTNAYTFDEHSENISALQNTLREIGRDKNYQSALTSSILVDKLGAISNAEQVIYQYYPVLACVVFDARLTSRQFGKLIYDSGYQYEETKGGNYLDGTNANAFVHAMWNAYIYTSLVKNYNYTSAEAAELTWLATAMHEYSDAGATKNLGWLSNVNMDLHNNAKGLEIAKEMIRYKYPGGFLGLSDNWQEREIDLALRIVNEVSNGELLRNKKIDYNTQNKMVVLINSISSSPVKTDGSERNPSLTDNFKLRNALLLLVNGGYV